MTGLRGLLNLFCLYDRLKKTVPVVWILEYPASNTRRFVKYDLKNGQYPTCSGVENSTQIVSHSVSLSIGKILLGKYL
jgi:hypothetical protein